MSKQTEALKLALEALEEIHHGNMTPMAEGNWNKAITAIREALAEQPAQQQEPVCNKDPQGCWSVRCQLGKVCKNKYPPASKPWVGLTDDEVSKLIDNEIGFNSCCGWEEQYTRAVEAKLREKNA